MVKAKAKARKRAIPADAEYRAVKYTDRVNHNQTAYVLLVATRQTVVATPTGWAVSVTETRWLIPAKVVQKQAPNKT
jgi:hypothetical protein